METTMSFISGGSNHETLINATEASSNESTLEFADEPLFTTLSQTILGIIGIIGNMCVIIVLSHDRKLRNRIINIYILNQSVIDGLASLLLFLHAFTVKNTYKVELGLRGQIHCLMWKSRLFLWWMYVSSTYNIVVMSIERYLELVHSLWHRAFFTKKMVFLSLVFVWVFGAAVDIPYQILPSKAINGVCILYVFYPSTFAMRATGILIFSIAHLIPVLILVLVYGRIAWYLSQQISTDLVNQPKLEQNNKKSGEANTQIVNQAVDMRRKNIELAKRNTIKTLLVVAICFIVCWTGNQVWLLMFNLGLEMNWDSPAYQFFVLMICVNCVINPIIYLIQYRDFQKAIKKMFCKKKDEMSSSFSDFSHSTNTVMSDATSE